MQLFLYVDDGASIAADTMAYVYLICSLVVVVAHGFTRSALHDKWEKLYQV